MFAGKNWILACLTLAAASLACAQDDHDARRMFKPSFQVEMRIAELRGLLQHYLKNSNVISSDAEQIPHTLNAVEDEKKADLAANPGGDLTPDQQGKLNAELDPCGRILGEANTSYSLSQPSAGASWTYTYGGPVEKAPQPVTNTPPSFQNPVPQSYVPTPPAASNPNYLEVSQKSMVTFQKLQKKYMDRTIQKAEFVAEQEKFNAVRTELNQDYQQALKSKEQDIYLYQKENLDAELDNLSTAVDGL